MTTPMNEVAENEGQIIYQYLSLLHSDEALPLPNIIGVGAPRCGTRALYRALSQTPNIYMSDVKEIEYFTRWYDEWSEREYALLFAPGRRMDWRCEITPSYLHAPRVPARVKKSVPDALILIQVRDPVDRAISNYYLLGGEKLGPIDEFFAEGLRQMEEDPTAYARWNSPARVIQTSLYRSAIERYLDHFPAEQVCLIALEDLKSDPATALSRLRKKTDLKITSVEKANARMRTLPLSAEMKSRLTEYFSDDWSWTKDQTGAIRA